MLVFKRALSVALSVLLACPVTVWARSEKPHAKSSAKSIGKRGFVPTAQPSERRHISSRSATAVNSKSKRMPAGRTVVQASKAPKEIKMAPGLALASVMPKSSAKKNGFDVQEIKGKGNRLKSRLVSKGDYKELIVDTDGDGFADVYEVTRGGLTAKASYPDRGRFTQIDFTQKHVKGDIKSVVFYNPTLKKYVLASSEIAAHKRNLNSVVNSGAKFGEICTEQLDYLTAFEALMKQIQDAVTGPKASALECKLNAYQDLFFDKSCDSGEFKDSKQDMIKGLAKLMASRGETKPAQYLQCLEDSGLGYHSAKMQYTLSQKLNDLKKKMGETAVGGDAAFTSSSCERVEKIEVYKDNGHTTKKKVDEVAFGSDDTKKLFKCSASKSCWGSHIDNQITLCSGSEALSKSYGTAAPDAYGSLMMHELLHDTDLNGNDEPLIENIQNCCAPSKYGATETANACATIKQTGKDSQFIAALNQTAGYSTAISLLSESMGQDEAKKFLANIAIKFRNKPEGQAALRAYGTCQASAQDDTQKMAECRSELLNKVGDFAIPHTQKDMCEAWKTTNPEFSCSRIVGNLTEALKPRDSSYYQQRSPLIIVPEGELVTIKPFTTLDLAPIELPLLDVRTGETEPEQTTTTPLAKGSPKASGTGTSKVASNTASSNAAAIAATQDPAAAAPSRASTGSAPTSAPAKTSTTTTASSSTGSNTAGAGSKTPSSNQQGGKMESEVTVAGSNSNRGSESEIPASNQPVSNQPTNVSANSNQGGNSEAGDASTASNNAGTSNQMPTSNSGYVPSSRNSYPQPSGNLAMPSANTLGTQQATFGAAPVADALLTAGSKVTSAIQRAVASAPANAQTVAAQNIVNSPTVSQGSTFSSWAGSSTSNAGSRTIASRGSSSGGGRGSSVSSRSNSQGAKSAKSSGGEDEKDSKSNLSGARQAKADANAETSTDSDESALDSETSIQGGKAEGAAQARGLAASSSGVAALGSLGGTGWKAGTFRSKFEATKFVVNAPAAKIVELAAKPNSAFERDLANQQIGIQMGGGRVVGYSEPNYQICGKKVVAIGACR